LLQNQFKQAVSQAMEGDGLAKETLSKADATKPKTNARPGKSATASAKTAAKNSESECLCRYQIKK
jgi:hypothetical protein